MATELVSPPSGARLFQMPAVARLGDAAPNGRVRLDAIARWLQDVALDDLVDTGLAGDGDWVVRRMRVRVERFPQLGEAVELQTFCSALGSAWAERRTTLRGEGGALVEAAALWIHLEVHGARPRAVPEAFARVHEPSIAGRAVRARLRHETQWPEDAVARPWAFRAADLDVASHVNNAAYWAVLEEELGELDPGASIDVEIEHRVPADAGPATVRSAGGDLWLTDASGTLLATMSRTPPE